MFADAAAILKSREAMPVKQNVQKKKDDSIYD